MAVAPMIPRGYQSEVAAQAVKENIIARADTGSGKTLIAVLLIRSVLSRPTRAGEKSLVVFTTPTTTLVTQQAGVIREQTIARVKAFIGAEVDFWKVERFQQEFADAEVVVCTPQVWLNILNSGYWSLRNCSLLIVDECHHCTKKHPSAEIMRQHYHPSKQEDSTRLPRVFGMTASPLWNAKNPAKAIGDIEALLDARIIELHTNSFRQELEQNTPKAVESLVEFDAIDGLSIPETMVDSTAEDASNGALDILLSARIYALLEVLRPYADKRDFGAIIFVEQRVHAVRLVRILQAVPDLATWLRPASLVGHGRGGWKETDQAERERRLEMEVKEQQAIVAKFRTGDYNVLVATKVAEEGLDFKACNLVVRFDALSTVTGYIQSRGRARAADARYVVLAERGSIEASRYRQFVQQEATLQDLYADRPDELDEQAEPDLDNLPTYATTQGALLSHQSAVSTLSGFCQLLKVDQYTPLQKPTFAIVAQSAGWVAKLQVPKTAALSQHTFVSEPMRTRRAAKQNAAFQACIALHRAGALDDHLLPVRPTRADNARDTDGRTLDRSPIPPIIEAQLMNPFGNVFASAKAHIYIFEIARTPNVRIALVCGAETQVPNRMMHEKDGKAFELRLLSHVRTTWQDSTERDERLAALEDFNRRLGRAVLNRRIGDDLIYALWTPVDSDGRLDWNLIREPFQRVDLAALASGTPLVVPLQRPTVRFGRFAGVRDDVTTSSLPSEIELDPGKKKKLVPKYANYKIFLRVMYGDEVGDVPDDEPILCLEPVDLQLHNALVAFKLADNVTSEGELTSSEPARMRYFPLSMLRTSKLSFNFFETLALPPIDSKLLATALTSPMSQVGYDYQSLEYVGDAALQLATSVHVFLRHPKADEELLSVMRSNSVDNRFLRRRALECGLSRFMLPHLLRPTTFVPETSDDATLSEDGLSIIKSVGRRLLSDTFEALLGAAVLSGGFSTMLLVADRLGLCTGGTTPWHERPDARTLVEVPALPAGAGLQQLQAAIGYTFQTQGQLLRRALTHRSWVEDSGCYEREEFLGDAILEWWATTRLHAMNLDAPPSSLTFARALLVSSGALALIGCRKLDLHKCILHSSPVLETALREAAEQAQQYSFEQVVNGDLTFLWSPPKVISDVVEAILAAVFIDASFQLEPVLLVLDRLFADIMPHVVLTTEIRDPYSRFLMLADSLACKLLTIKVTAVITDGEAIASSYEAVCSFHDEQLATISAPSKSVARQLAAEAGLARLAEGDVVKRCACKAERLAASAVVEDAPDQNGPASEDDMEIDPAVQPDLIAASQESDAMSD
ncbi:hypothetical protein JCM10908_002820 [Rhodotorula pacifica]|uniref:uncharacterized protein n=1 Tax=Rhodotorula pacifica TaxID=1495444 RepID=UPI00317E8FF2